MATQQPRPATISIICRTGGETPAEGIACGVAAPAEDLVGGLPGGLYADWSGTSGATPLVSGVAALIRAEYPEMSAAQVVNRIISTAKDAGVPGHDPIYGFGILDAEAALTAFLALDRPEVEAALADRARRLAKPTTDLPRPA